VPLGVAPTLAKSSKAVENAPAVIVRVTDPPMTVYPPMAVNAGQVQVTEPVTLFPAASFTGPEIVTSVCARKLIGAANAIIASSLCNRVMASPQKASLPSLE
jgi:hypothetical protein